MTVAAESSNSLHIEECDFNKPVLSEITAKYTIGNLIVK